MRFVQRKGERPDIFAMRVWVALLPDMLPRQRTASANWMHDIAWNLLDAEPLPPPPKDAP